MQRILGHKWRAKRRTRECSVIDPKRKKVSEKERQQLQRTLQNTNVAFGGH